MTSVTRVLGGVIAFIGVLFGGALLFGGRLRSRGQAPFVAVDLEAEGGRFAVTADGRIVEYFVYGSTDPEADVVVNMHGSGLEARFEVALYQSICDKLGVRGIAISLPGYGRTDMKPGRNVRDWANEDLLAVLDRESVQEFMITGHSQGTPHAMAAAYVHPDRCVGLGLNAPLLPTAVCHEEGLQGALGADSLFSTATLAQPYMAWYFTVYHLGVVTFSPALAMRPLLSDGPKLKKEPEVLERLSDTLRRSVIRGSVGGAWESAGDVCYEWGFDPREIQATNVCIWHAQDDSLCPPEPGRWLAEFFASRSGVQVNFRDDDEGCGHMTFCRGQYARPKTSMVAALLRGRSQD